MRGQDSRLSCEGNSCVLCVHIYGTGDAGDMCRGRDGCNVEGGEVVGVFEMNNVTAVYSYWHLVRRC